MIALEPVLSCIHDPAEKLLYVSSRLSRESAGGDSGPRTFRLSKTHELKIAVAVKRLLLRGILPACPPQPQSQSQRSWLENGCTMQEAQGRLERQAEAPC